jgi:hypothetical protein
MQHFTTNTTPSNWADCWFRLLQTMGSAGWQTIAWSDGTSVHNTPVANPYPYSTSSIGMTAASQLNNALAWIVMQQPPSSGSLTVGGNYAGTRQYGVQNSNGGDARTWRIKYSFSGGYTAPAAAGTATRMPVINSGISDEVFICGGGSDASPTFDFVFGGTNGGSRCNCMADDGFFVSGSNATPYGFYMITWTNGAGAGTEAEVGMDPMISGSCPAGDVDPFCFRRMNTTISTGIFNPFISQQTFGRAAGVNGVALTWFRKNNPQGAQFTGIAGGYWSRGNSSNGFQNAIPQQAGANVNSNEDDLLPVVMIRGASLGGFGGYKGVSSLIRYTSSIKTTGTALSVAGNRDRIVVNTCTLPWDGSLPTV